MPISCVRSNTDSASVLTIPRMAMSSDRNSKRNGDREELVDGALLIAAVLVAGEYLDVGKVAVHLGRGRLARGVDRRTPLAAVAYAR